MNTLSERLQFSLKKAEMSQADLASKIGVRPQVINYLYQCNPQASKYTYLIADALKVDPTWLATGSGSYQLKIQEASSHVHQVPIITYRQAKDMVNKLVNFDELDLGAWISTGVELSEHSFALKLKDKSMFPRFDEGALLVFDVNSSVVDGLISLVYNSVTDDIMVRQVVFNKHKQMLVAINHDYSSFEISKDHIMVGHLKEVRLYEKEHF